MMEDKATEAVQESSEKETKKKGIFPDILNNEKALSFIVILGLVGIALIFISSYIRPPSDDSEETVEESNVSASELATYRNEISEELGNMIASMDGAGRTKVMVTIDGTSRNIYATDVDVNDRETSRKSGTDENADKQNTEKKSCIVIRQKDGSEKALTVGQLMPEIKGVLVICDGGDDEAVCKNIIKAVSAALNISESHICVTKLNS